MSREYGEHCPECNKDKVRQGIIDQYDDCISQYGTIYLCQCLNCGITFKKTVDTKLEKLGFIGVTETVWKKADKSLR